MAVRRYRWKHRLINILESLLLMLSMLALLAFCAYLVWDKNGIWLVLISFSSFFIMMPVVSPSWLMRIYQAQPLDNRNFPEGIRLVKQLAKSANLPVAPRLFYLPSASPNAFSAGQRGNSTIAITQGILRIMNKRELAGVLAHEISHIHNNDLWIMGLADLISRLTLLMARVGMILLFLNLPFLFSGEISWLLVTLLIFSPYISIIMQLSLSRLREYEADLFAVGLTDDPQGLAQALEKLEYFEAKLWQRIFMPGRPKLEPSILRSHPPTSQRVERLLSMAQQAKSRSDGNDMIGHNITPAPRHRSRWHWPGSSL
ncbi:MAG: M48 family metalloprotease [Gammaproteobacteria bacterium]|nr:M48 family metalloprotease [Gammaproteobacteria bacterium]